MARGRMISKSWSTSKKRAALYTQTGPLAEFCLQLFPLLVVHSDDYGCLDADPQTVKFICDPGSPRSVEEFESAFRSMEMVGLIQRYQADGANWLQVLKFDDHQPGLLSKRTTRKSPLPPTYTEPAGNSGLTKLNLTKPNLTQKSVSAEPPKRVSPPDTSPVRLEFPVVGTDHPTWALRQGQIDLWRELFPGLDVVAEAKQALAWVIANPGRRKTGSGMPRFLVSWFTRSVNRGGARNRAAENTPASNVPGVEATREKYLGGGRR